MCAKAERDPKWFDQITPELTEVVVARSVDGKITCEVAQKIAGELGVPKPVVGAAADQAGIRVHNCSLGCF